MAGILCRSPAEILSDFVLGMPKNVISPLSLVDVSLPVHYLPSSLLSHHSQQSVPEVFSHQLVVEDLVFELNQTQVIHIGRLTLVNIHTVLKDNMVKGHHKEMSPWHVAGKGSPAIVRPSLAP